MLGNILHLAEGVVLGVVASSPSLSGDALKAAVMKSLQDSATQQAERLHKGLGVVVGTLFSLSITRNLIDRAVDDALGRAKSLLASLPFGAALLSQATAPAQPAVGGTQPAQGTSSGVPSQPTIPASAGQTIGQTGAAPKPPATGQSQ